MKQEEEEKCHKIIGTNNLSLIQRLQVRVRNYSKGAMRHISECDCTRDDLALFQGLEYGDSLETQVKRNLNMTAPGMISP